MQTIEALLTRALGPGDDEHTLTLEPAFQGLPDVAHGGAVLAVVDAVAERRGPRRVTGLYRRRVPLDQPLALRVRRAEDAVVCRLLDTARTTLVEGRVEAAAAGGGALAAPAGEGWPLPISSGCFACGVDNPVGLRARLAFDDARVWVTWRPLDGFRARGGTLAPVALCALVDEVAFWLGALATGEAGMTTRIDLVLAGDVPFDTAVTAAGARADVRPRADDPRYLETRVVAADAAGAVVAAADVTFVAIRGAARKLTSRMLDLNPPEVLRRVFPARGIGTA
jgi:hypothetical protein